MSLLDGSGMTGDIWSTGAFAVESPLKDLLDSGNFTLEQLLAEDELLQELRGLHPQLLDYFSTEEAVTKLVHYLILDPNSPVSEPPSSSPPIDGDDEGAETKEVGDEKAEKKEEPGKWLFQHLEDETSNERDKAPGRNPDNLFVRFPYMACEIICCELQGVINVLVDGYAPSSDEPDSAENEEKQQPQEGDAPAEATQEAEEEKGKGRQRILDVLFSVLYDTPTGQLDDYRAGYLEKILSILFRKRPQALSEYINSGGGKGNVTLMKEMFRHLYSHSIMQLVQRLLLPQPPQLHPHPDISADDGEEDDGNLILGAPGMEGMASPGGVIAEEADDETKTLQCNWSESSEGLNLLLQPLINPTKAKAENGSKPTEEEEERRVQLCQNSSEVLITIIQNSPLNSQTMLRLTADPIMEKLIDSASRLEEGEDFGPHESTLTSAMNVLESLILQLGGYGSVGTISLVPTEENGEDGKTADEPPPQFADLQALLVHIPRLLRSLSELLRHPSCENWRSPMQYAKPTEPQQLLGMSRLRIVRLLESLVLLGESNVDSLLCESDCLEICLNLFWKFQWCSMLHQSVANLLVHVFEGANARSDMQEYFLVKCNLLGRLMDSFAETITGAPDFGSRDTAPMPDFTEQELVIAMKDVKMNAGGAGVNAPQPNDLGDDGLGVPSEDVIPVSDDDVDAVLEQQVEQQEAADAAAAAAAMVDLAEGLKEPAIMQETSAKSVGQVSTEAVRFESRDASTVGAMLDGAPAQSFRLGYMGHVIIICQALVHACSNEGDDELEDTAPDSAMGEDDDRRSLLADSQADDGAKMNGLRNQGNNNSSAGTADNQDMPAGRDDGESARGMDSNAEGAPPQNPLVLSKLIENHPLRSRWDEFVKSTLSTETAIQSTPLGGYNNPLPGGDPLHAHRPLGDGDDFDDGSGQPNIPPRGMLGGGDLIDMDDNDLDIAASMMAGLHLARGADDDDDGDDDDDSSGDDDDDGSGNTYDSGEKRKGYFFDDPLGGKQSGLGLALGNLKQYHEGSDDEDDNGSGKGSDHSSDEDEGTGTLRRTTSSGDVPVMNLFPGNFSPDEAKSSEANFDEGVWSNFANFDDAFAGASAEGQQATDTGFTADFEHADVGEAPPPTTDPFPPGPDTADIDDIFGKPTTHAILLDDTTDLDSNKKEEAETTEASESDGSTPLQEEKPEEESGA